MKRLLFIFSAFFITEAQNSQAQALQEYSQSFAMPANIHWQNTEGENVSIANYKGKVVLLNLWATWCGPCVFEMPMFDFLQKRYKAAGFEVIAVTPDDSLEDIAKFYQKNNIKNLKAFTDTHKILKSSMNVKSFPATFLINRQGEIVAAKEGLADWLGDDVRGQIEAELRKDFTKESQNNIEVIDGMFGNIYNPMPQN